MPDINLMAARSGKVIKSDNTVVNEADGINSDGSRNVKLTGSNLDQRGLAANKPDATSVQPGTTYWSVDTDPQAEVVEVSDGTKWTVI